tara:strand:- start:234 stop:407 length:174 start_codon:yes stop_codon:yes gene_type:complete
MIIDIELQTPTTRITKYVLRWVSSAWQEFKPLKKDSRNNLFPPDPVLLAPKRGEIFV